MSWSTFTAAGERKTSSSAGALGWEIIDRVVLGGGTNFHDFPLDNSKFEQFQIRMIDIFPNNDEANVRFKVSVDGGSSFLTGTEYHRAGAHGRDNDSTVGGANQINTSGMTVTFDGLGNGPNDALSGWLDLFNTVPVGNRVRANSRANYGRFPDTSNMYTNHNYYVDTSGSTVDAIRFETNGSTVTGRLILMGLPKVIKVNDAVVLPPAGWQVIETKNEVGAANVEFKDIDQFDASEIATPIPHSKCKSVSTTDQVILPPTTGIIRLACL
jgi:hypothetical protein